MSLRARTAVTAWTRLPGAGHDQGRSDVRHGADLGQPGEDRIVERDRRPEAQSLLRVDLADDAGRRVEGDDLPGVDDGDPVGEPLGLLHEVGHQDDGHAAVADALDQVPGVTPGLRVEPGRQLVEDGDARVADEGQRDRQPLLLPARQLAEGGLALVVRPRSSMSRSQSAGVS